MGLKVGRPSSHKPCTHLPLGACTGEDTRGAPPRGCIFGVTWLGIFLWATHHRHTEVTSHKQTEATITATKRLRGYKKKKSREKAHFLFNRILYHQGCIFFHTFIFALSQHLCSCRRERIPKSTKAKRTISVRSHNKHISGTGAHVARR